MRLYFYEYKYKSGSTVGGHNHQEIKFNDNKIILLGYDFINDSTLFWRDVIDMDNIEYLKIELMKEGEEDES